MATNPPPTAPASMPPIGDQRLEDALRFSQALADHELAAIDRIHARTVRYIGFVVAVFVAGFGLLGYFGYKNLHDLAVGVATRQVRAETAQQVQLQLTKEGITEIVQGQIHEFAERELHDQIRTEITKGRLHQEIVSTATGQSKQLIASMFAQRHFTIAQATRLKVAIADHTDLIGYPVTTRPMLANLEATRYEEEIAAALTQTKLGIGNKDAYADAPASEGVVIYHEEKFGERYADSLAKAFLSG
jgi:hypothetical protein